MRFLYILRAFSLFFLVSCGPSQAEIEAKRLAYENLQMRSEMEQQKRLADSIAAEQTKQLVENQQKLAEQIQKQDETHTLTLKAENTPLELSSMALRNVTSNGTILKQGNLFLKNEVRYIEYNGYFIDNAAKAGKKTKGTIYQRYLYKEGDNWYLFSKNGTFKTINGEEKGYTRSFRNVSDTRETYYETHKLGSETGGDFKVAKWVIEIYYDPDDANVGYFMNSGSFEVY